MTDVERAARRISITSLEVVLDLIRKRPKPTGMHVYPGQLDHAAAELAGLLRAKRMETNDD